jgi:hypothetical protein
MKFCFEVIGFIQIKTPPPFSRTDPEKGGEAGESGVDPKNSSPLTPASPPSPPFFRSLSDNCGVVAASSSINGRHNGPRFIMVQRIFPQPMVVLSAGVGELTLSAE